MFGFIKDLSKEKRMVLFTCFFAFFCNGAITLTMGSAMPDLKQTYGLSDTISGVLLSANSIGNMVAGFISGILPLYLGRKRSIILMSALSFIGFLMLLVWGNPLWMFVAFLFAGTGRGSVSNFNNREVNILSNGSPAAANLLHGCFAIGAIITPMVYLLLRTYVGWQAGILVVVGYGCISLWNMSRMQLEDDSPSREDKTQVTLSFMKNPSFIILTLMLFCYLCSEYAINGWLVTYLQNKESLAVSFGSTGVELQQAIAAYSQTMATLMWIVMLLGRLMCAALSARISQKVLMAVCSVGIAASFGLMLLSNSIAAVTVAVAGLGLCMSGVCPMIYSDASPFTNKYSMATSMMLTVGSIGGMVMPIAVGALAERFGFTGGMSAIMVSIVLLVVCAVLNVVYKPRIPLDEDASV